MQLFIGCTLSAVIGAVLGGFAVRGWLRAKYERVDYDQFVRPCFPPMLTLIEGGLKTGTDR